MVLALTVLSPRLADQLARFEIEAGYLVLVVHEAEHGVASFCCIVGT